MRSVVPGQSFNVQGGVIGTAGSVNGGAESHFTNQERLRPSAGTRNTTVAVNATAQKSNNATPTLDYSKLAREFNNVRSRNISNTEPETKPTTNSNKAAKLLSEVEDEQPQEQVSENLQLTTRIRIQTTFAPKLDRNVNWSLEDELSDQINTFELNTLVSETECRYALNELMIMIEDDTCERFYVLDEAGQTAAVICGANTAFWSGTTSVIRGDLKRRGIPFKIPLAKSAEAVAGVDRLRDLRDDTNRAAILTSQLEEKKCTLYFDSTFAVRGMIEAFVNMTRTDAKLKIVASQAFPGCTIKVSRAQRMHKLSRNTELSQWITTWEGYFTVVDRDKLIRAFTKINGNHINVNVDHSPLTREFDQVAHVVFQSPMPGQETTRPNAEEEEGDL